MADPASASDWREQFFNYRNHRGTKYMTSELQVAPGRYFASSSNNTRCLEEAFGIILKRFTQSVIFLLKIRLRWIEVSLCN